MLETLSGQDRIHYAAVTIGNKNTGKVQFCELRITIRVGGSVASKGGKCFPKDIDPLGDALGQPPYTFSGHPLPTHDPSQTAGSFQWEYIALSEQSQQVAYCTFVSTNEPYHCVSADLK